MANVTSTRLILCIKWGDVFSPEYVNILYRACRDHLTGPIQFVCLTDDTAGLLPEISALPIPNIGLTQDQWYTRGVWPKLALFRKKLHNLSGRALFIDLDMMIVGSLDPFFDETYPLTTLDVGDGWRPNGDAPPEVGTGVFAFNIGEQSQILDGFMADSNGVIATFHNEQDYVSEMGQGIGFWPTGTVISFKRFLRRGLGRDLFESPQPPGPNVAIVAFHGAPRPIDLVTTKVWGQFPHIGLGPVPWVQEYWKKYGS